MYRIPELLAPAGGINQFSAAVENGADAVYIGGTRFNARMNADNFTEGAMEECIRYAHTRGAAVHVTMNTLLSDSELPEALRYAARVCELGADALIVQDPGLAWLLHSMLPEMELHLSTQGTVYNAAGVKQAAELGFSRVVLARETSLAEIKKIAAAVDTERVELEVFVHGALCMCYSGQCHLSRVIGGRSGNRGACAQPCRLGYQIYRSADRADGIGELDRSNGTGEVNRADGTGGSSFPRRTLLGSGFLLSPGDLCGIDHLKELSEAGVASLKIEGRMKSPEYVGVVTGIYRRCLDEYAETGKYTVRPEERLALAQIFSRGEFTTGYLFGNPRRELLSGELSKHQGIRIGTVRAYNAKRKTVQVSLDAPLATGDGVEIHSRTTAGETRLTGNVITYQKGNEIGYIKEPVCPGDPIYKITDKALMERARVTYERKSGAERKQQRKRGITMEFYARPGETARLTAWLGKEKQKGSSTACNSPGESSGKGLMAAVYSADCAERAKTRPLDGELLRRQLEKTGDTPFALGKLCFDLGEEPVSISVSVLNDMRRRVLAELEAKILEPASPAWRNGQGSALRPTLRAHEAAAALPELLYGADTAASGAGTADTVSAGTAGQAGGVRPGRVAYYLFSADEEALELAACAHHTVEAGLSVPVSRFYLPYELFLRKEYRQALEQLKATGKEVIPVLPPVTRGREDAFLSANMGKLKELALEHGICVGNLWQIAPFAGAGARVYGDFGLNAVNGSDVFLAGKLGLCGLSLSCETLSARTGMRNDSEPFFDYEAMSRAADKAGIELELPAGGQIPLMISAHCPIGDATGCRGYGETRGGGDGETGACDSGHYFLADRKNQYYPLLTRKADCQTLLFRDEPLDNRKIIREFRKKSGVNLRYYGIDKKIFCDRP